MACDEQPDGMPMPSIEPQIGASPATERGGDPPAPRNESLAMTNDQGNSERSGRLERERLCALGKAREQMVALLLVLDENSRSPAAATLDLAIHYLTSELDG